MAKLTPDERAALEQQLADDDADDGDFDFHYSEGDRSISLPWSKRESLGELGFKVPAKKPAAPKGGTGGQDPKADGGRPRNVSVFGPRNRSTGST
jgi:hypothetical protein